MDTPFHNLNRRLLGYAEEYDAKARAILLPPPAGPPDKWVTGGREARAAEYRAIAADFRKLADR